MRHYLVTCLGLALVCATGCRRGQPVAATELWLGWHFIGAAAAGADPEAARVREIWSLPESVELREQTLDRLASALAKLFPTSALPDAGQGSALLRPLLSDLLAAESYAEVLGRASEPLVWTLAIRLTEDRAAQWRANLFRLVGGNPAAPTDVLRWVHRQAGSSGGATNHFSFERAGEWVVFGAARASESPKLSEWARKIQTTGRPIPVATNYWLQAELNLARLAPWLPPGFGPASPTARLTVHCKEDFLRANARLLYAQEQEWLLEPWSIPLNSITDPPHNQLTSFTALRGFGPWLARQPLVQELALSPAPNQLFLWSHTAVGFHTFFALPVRQAANTLERLAAWLPGRLPRFLAESEATGLQWTTNRSEFVLPKLPFALPFCRATREAGGDFLVGGLLPPIRSTNPPPAELLREVTSRTNLLCYEWEVSAARLLHWRVIGQLCSIAVGQKPAATNRLSQRWIEAVAPKLDNTVTVASVESAKEVSLARKSRLGFNSLELVALAHWLDDPAFPAWQVPALFREAPGEATKAPPPSPPLASAARAKQAEPPKRR